MICLMLVVAAALATRAAVDSGPDPHGGAAAIAAANGRDRFDSRRAFAFLREQVEQYGPRPAGSQASRRLAARLRRSLPRGRYERVPGGLRNVVGRIPGSRPAILIGAHYDTEATVEGHLGANDGAAGTAVLVELARVMRQMRRRDGAPELRFVAFDGEEEPSGCPDAEFEQCALRGSKAYVKAHRRSVRAMILLDYVGEKGLRVPREGSSDIALWSGLRTAARRVGKAQTFPDEVGPAIIDDHTPFLRAGVPAVDIIDFDYPYRDSLEDTVDKTSPQSLDAVGETVTEFLVSWSR